MSENFEKNLADKKLEIEAISKVFEILKDLPKESVIRVLDYFYSTLNHVSKVASKSTAQDFEKSSNEEFSVEENLGISSVGKKWMLRNGFSEVALSQIYTIGLEDFDIVVKNLSGKSKKERTRKIFILSGIASYLKDGSPKFTHEKARETCMHYDAWDSDNFASYMKSFNSEIAGNRTSGYLLTARGISSGAELLKELIQ